MATVSSNVNCFRVSSEISRKRSPFPSISNPRLCEGKYRNSCTLHSSSSVPFKSVQSTCRPLGSSIASPTYRNSIHGRYYVAIDGTSFVQEDADEELEKLLCLLPPSIRSSLRAHPQLHSLIEIVLDLGRTPIARFPDGEFCIDNAPVSAEDLEFAVSQVGEFGADNRAGIDRTLHRISAIRNRSGRIVGLTCRVGRAINGAAALISDLVTNGSSLLLMGPPGVGKTTAIREVARLLADEQHRRVVIVDTSNEIGGDGDIPHTGIGRARRMQVPHVDMQHEVMIEAVENHMPQVIVIDEIGTELEAMAAGTIAQRGVQLVGTAHGCTVENLIKNPALQDLAGGIQSVTLGDEEARRRGVQKSILERKGPPVFSSAVEIVSKSDWRVHRNLAATVDTLLAGRPPRVEIRKLAADGSIQRSQPHQAVGVGREVLYSSDSEEEVEEEYEEAYSYGMPGLSMSTSTAGKMDDADIIGNDCLMLRTGPLLLYTYQVTEENLQQVLEVMGVEQLVQTTGDIGEADAVLALRSKLRQNSWLRGVAKYRQLPIYAIKGNTMAQMVRAMRAILGMDMLGARTPATSDNGNSSSSGGSSPWKSSLGEYGYKWQQPRPGLSSSFEDEIDALEEARLAVEQIVIPKSQPVELLPRGAAILDLQVKLIHGYQLQFERVGKDINCRLRILPRPSSNFLAAGEVDGQGSTPAPSKGQNLVVEMDGQLSVYDYVENESSAGLSVNSLPVLEDDT